MPEKTPEQLTFEKALEQLAKDQEQLVRDIGVYNTRKADLEKALEQLDKDRKALEKEKAELEADKPEAAPEPEKVKPWERKKEYTVKSDLMYNGKVLRTGRKSNLSKLNDTAVQRLESGEVIE